MWKFVIAAFLCGAIFGQPQSPTEAPSTFDVASIKPAVLISTRCGYRMEGGPGTADPGRLAFHNISLAALVRFAYFGQIHACDSSVLSAPAWLDSEGFEIAAKIPAGTSPSQVRLMLQNLLTERFKLATHREPKVVSAYALTVAKSGPKFKVSVDAPATSAANEKSKPSTDKDGFPVPAPPGSWIITRNGHTRMQQRKIDLGTLARQLQNQLDRPVTDATGLQGTYDFTLSWTADSSVTPDSDAPPDIFMALQQQLGLKLEASKITIETIVVDHAEKTPIEN